MNLFVTGGAGFIGANFIHLALERGHSVLNFDALTYAGNPKNLEGISHPEQYRFVRGDIRDSEAIRLALQQQFDGRPFDVCINFAAESHVDRSIHAARIFTETNVLGTVTLIEAMREASVPMFLQVSTDEVFGSASEGDVFTLKSEIKPSSPYSASKAAADYLALSFHHTHGYDVRVTRCTNNYGRFQYPEKFIPTIITRAIRSLDVPVYGDGLQIRDWIYVDDHCEGIFAAIERGKPGGVYLFGGSSLDNSSPELQNIELAQAILKIIARMQGKDETALLNLIKHVTDRLGHDRRYAMDWSQTAKALNWKPRMQFAEGVERTVAWYLKNEGWWKPLLAVNG